MVAPVLLIVPAVISGAAGLYKGARGAQKVREAQRQVDVARERHDKCEQLTQRAVSKANRRAHAYGASQQRVVDTTIHDFVAWVREQGRKAAVDDLSSLDGLGVSESELADFEELLLEVKSLAAGALRAAGAGFATRQAALTLVGLFGAASTGTAISSLGGVAATNATLAALGGGSLASGGGGIALGVQVLGGITAAPAVLITGFVLNAQGEKALTRARVFERDVSVAAADRGRQRAFLREVVRRVDELEELLTRLDLRAGAALDRLRVVDFAPGEHAGLFQEALLYVKALAEIVRTPVLSEERGSDRLNPTAADVAVRYRALIAEKEPS